MGLFELFFKFCLRPRFQNMIFMLFVMQSAWVCTEFSIDDQNGFVWFSSMNWRWRKLGRKLFRKTFLQDQKNKSIEIWRFEADSKLVSFSETRHLWRWVLNPTRKRSFKECHSWLWRTTVRKYFENSDSCEKNHLGAASRQYTLWF